MRRVAIRVHPAAVPPERVLSRALVQEPARVGFHSGIHVRCDWLRLQKVHQHPPGGVVGRPCRRRQKWRGLLAKKSGNVFRVGIFLDFASSSTRAPHVCVCGAYVQMSGGNRIDLNGGEVERLGTRTFDRNGELAGDGDRDGLAKRPRDALGGDDPNQSASVLPPSFGSYAPSTPQKLS